MIYLLDTDTLIDAIRGLKSARKPAHRRRADSFVRRCQDAQAAGDVVGLSAITVSELEFGARHSGSYDAEIAAVQKVLAPFEAFDYDAVVCPEHYGLVREQLQSKGVGIGAMDLLIAAHAMALGATLITSNTAHFSRVSGLTTENWLTG